MFYKSICILFFVVLFFQQTASAGYTNAFLYSPFLDNNVNFTEAGISGKYHIDPKSIVQFGAEYQTEINDRFDYVLGGSYISRSLDNATFNGSSISFTGKYPSVSTILLYGNVVFKLTDWFSVFGGLNYPFVSYDKGSSGPDAALTGSLGSQYGISGRLWHLQCDIGNRYENFSGKNNTTGNNINDGKVLTIYMEVKLVNIEKLFNLF